MDDQFAYIPNAFAATYFDGPPDPTDPDTKIAAAARAAASGDEGYVMVATHAKSCMWPEGALTCRVMRGGAKLELLAARMRIVKWCSGRDKMRCRPSWGNGGKCRGSPWGPKTDNGPKPPTVAATNWVMLKDGKLPRRDAPTTAAMGTGCMTVVGEGGQSKESVVVACGSRCHSLPVGLRLDLRAASWLLHMQDCEYFWIYTRGQMLGRCCTKRSFDDAMGFRDKPAAAGEYYKMTTAPATRVRGGPKPNG